MEEHFPFREIEPRWQRRWRDLFKCDVSRDERKYYCLMMFPYPSGYLHVGHGRNYIIGDALARYKMMEGYNVLAPMGWDAFGLPAENAAIKNQISPAAWTEQNIAYMKRQFDQWGVVYDWSREVTSCRPDYYRWTQWLFLKLYEAGLAYQADASVNWCPSCKTVLANEQVVGGECERCASGVRQRKLRQWFFRITAYADRLLDDLETLDNWPERVVAMQRNWIGRSEGVEVAFPLENGAEGLNCFTTRVDTIFGATFIVIAVDHPLAAVLLERGGREREGAEFIERVARMRIEERERTEFTKEGLFTGCYALNPATKQRIPVFLASYVVMDYGTGVVMGVPAHDQRDFEFVAEAELDIPVTRVILEAGALEGPLREAWVGDGIMINSCAFNGLTNQEAMAGITEFLERAGVARRAVHYRLKDWLISRQRYWGAPIPMIHCPSCGAVAVPEDELPVVLPADADFMPRGDGKSPLAASRDFVEVECPACGGPAERDTDTMDTFVDSSWYYLRYLSPHEETCPFDKTLVDRWLPVDQYIGGIEHAILHLLYARFIVKFLCDKEFVSFSEPFGNLFTQGMITRSGAKMSKSAGNTVDPKPLIDSYGADTVRVYTLFIGPPEKDAEWNDRAVEGASRFINRVWRLYASHADLFQRDVQETPLPDPASLDERHCGLYRKVHQTIWRVRRDILGGAFHFNTAISALMELVNEMYLFIEAKKDSLDREQTVFLLRFALENLLLCLAPMAPHLCEEIWAGMGHPRSIFESSLPQADSGWLQQDTYTLVVQVNGKVRSKIAVESQAERAELERIALGDERVANSINGREIQKVIVIPGKIINIVVDS